MLAFIGLFLRRALQADKQQLTKRKRSMHWIVSLIGGIGSLPTYFFACMLLLSIQGGLLLMVLLCISGNELPEFLGGAWKCGNEEGCLRSDKGPWKDPEVLRIIQSGEAKIGKTNFSFSTDEKMLSAGEIFYHKRQDSISGATEDAMSPKFSWRMIEHSQLSPVREEVSRSVQMKNMCPAFLDVPMVDKDVDATWKKEMSDGKIIVAKGHYDVTDVCKNVKLNGGVFTGVMAFAMGVVTMTKMSKNLPRKAVDERARCLLLQRNGEGADSSF